MCLFAIIAFLLVLFVSSVTEPQIETLEDK
jgi:hypothetical protein